MSAWAETSVKARTGSARHDYPPVDGEACGQCDRPLHQGERVYRLTERGDDAWVCEACLSKPPASQVAAADNGMGC